MGGLGGDLYIYRIDNEDPLLKLQIIDNISEDNRDALTAFYFIETNKYHVIGS